MSDLDERLAALAPEKLALLEQPPPPPGESRASSRGASSRIPRREGTAPPPLSFAQERLWFFEQFHPGSPVYNLAQVIPLAPLDVAALRRSLDEIVRRHETLRTRFVVLDGEPVQKIDPAAPVDVEVTDLRHFEPPQRYAEASRLAVEDAWRPFDLERGPVFRASLLRLGEAEYWLLLNMHHIVSDGWSLGLFWHELNLLYPAHLEGRAAELPELPIQYADFAVWQRRKLRGEELERLLAYWRRRLDGAPAVLELPIDRTRPAVETYRGAAQALPVPGPTAGALRELGRQHGVTLFIALLAAFETLVLRYTGEDDLVVGAPTASRNRVEIEGLIGFFVNTLVLRTDLSGNPTFRELLEQVGEVSLGADAHQELPFEKLVQELQPERDMSHHPLFQVAFAMQSFPQPGGSAAAAEGTPNAPVGDVGDGRPEPSPDALQVFEGTAKFDLTLAVSEVGQGLSVLCEYKTDLFEHTTIHRLLRHYGNLLRAVAEDPDQRLWELPLGSREERRQVLTEWSGARSDHLGEPLLHRFVSLRGQAAAGDDEVPSRLRFLVLDRYGQPVPVGVVGELHLAVDRVEELDLPLDRSLEIASPRAPGGRLWRSGELARYRGDGKIEPLGSSDRRLRLDGRRFQLDRLEALLESHPAVARAVAVPHRDAYGERCVAVYLVASEEEPIVEEEIRALLREELVDGVRWVATAVVERLPRNAAGELEIAELPVPERRSADDRIMPRNALEAQLARIWSEILKVEAVGVHANFFDLGGHSLSAVQVLSRLRQTFGVELSLPRFFEAPSVAQLAELVAAEQREDELRPPSPVDRIDRLAPGPAEDVGFVDELSAAEVDAMLGELLAEEERGETAPGSGRPPPPGADVIPRIEREEEQVARVDRLSDHQVDALLTEMLAGEEGEP